MKNNIAQLLNSDISKYRISKDTGIAQSTLSDFATGKSKIGNMKLDHAITLNDYYNKIKGDIKMKAYYVYVEGKQVVVTATSEKEAKEYYESISENQEEVIHVEQIKTTELLTTSMFHTDSLKGGN